MELSKLDAQILRFIQTNGPSSIAEIKNACPQISAIGLRVDGMSQPEVRVEAMRMRDVPNTSYLLQDHGLYDLTELGRQALQDFDTTNTDRKRELWLKNAWIPILVSFITTVVSNYILPRLPSLLQWLANMFARIRA